MKLAIGEGNEFEVKLNFYTLYLYEQEFNSDMIKDVFGKVRISNSTDDELVLDYTNTNWTALTKAMWAACKCADDNIESYGAWAKKLEGVNLYALSGEFVTLIIQELFRTGVPADLSE